MAGNGDLDPSALGYVSGHRLRADLVPQTVAMVAAALRDGVVLRITQAYRSYAQQVAIFRARYTARTTGYGPYGEVKIWNGVRYVRTSGAAAAVPGNSNHGLGQAIDFATDSPGAIAWLTRNGARYGWARPAWTFRAPTIEPWHWEAVPVLVSNPIGGGGTVPTVPDLPPLAPIEEIDDMPTAAEIADAVWNKVLSDPNALPGGAPAFSLLIGSRLDAHGPETAQSVWEYLVDRPDRPVADALTYLVDTRMAVGAPDASVDVAALAAALAAALEPLVSSGLTEAQIVAAVKSVFSGTKLVVE